MTVLLPPPIPLDMPPGDPAGLADLARVVVSAAFRLAVLDGHLTGPAAAAPGWLGEDAQAAVVQLQRLGELVREGSAALDAAGSRVSRHHEHLVSARAFVTALREHQEADFAVAEYRLARLIDHAAQVSSATDDPRAVAVVEELAMAEAGRRRQHATAIEEVVHDAAATALALAEASAVFGGTGRRGDAGRAVAYLAAELPGWGDAELTARGYTVAQGFIGGPVTPEEMDALARDASAYGGMAAFAKALLAGLGADGVTYLFLSLGYRTLEGGGAVARLLASAFGAARPTGAAHDPVGEVLGAVYVRSGERYGESDVAAAGMAAVLAAARGSGQPGIRPETVAAWARQLVARERDQGLAAGAGAVPGTRDPVTSDPLALVMAALADDGNPGMAAGLLAMQGAWDVLLSRFWPDGGVTLSSVIHLAGQAPGPTGEAAIRSGLVALGNGLADGGDTADWTVSRWTAEAVTPALGEAVAAHVTVATDALGVGVDGRMTEERDGVLRGLGYLTVDRQAAAAVEQALRSWAQVQPTSLQGASPVQPLPAVAVPAAWLALQQYGQRLVYAMHGFDAQRDAENRETFWNWTFGLIPNLLSGGPGVVAGLATDYAAIALGNDGTWDNGVDRGMVFGREDAAAALEAGLPPDRVADADAVARQARAAYDRTLRALGHPEPPTSPESDWLRPVLDAMVGLAGERLDKLPSVPRPR